MVDLIAYLKNGSVKRIDDANTFYFQPSNKEEGQLLGHLNEVILEGRSQLFRPTEFIISDFGIPLKYRNTIHTGLFYFNYFETENDEEVMLEDWGIDFFYIDTKEKLEWMVIVALQIFINQTGCEVSHVLTNQKFKEFAVIQEYSCLGKNFMMFNNRTEINTVDNSLEDIFLDLVETQ